MRIEEWETDGVRTLLAMAARGRRVLACALSVGEGGGTWRHAEAWLSRGALSAPRRAVASVLPFGDATSHEALRYLGARTTGLAGRLAISTPASMPDFDASIRPVEGLLRPHDLPEGWAPSPRPEAIAALSHGDPTPARRPVALCPPPRPGRAETAPIRLAVPDRIAGPRAGLYLIGVIAGLLEPPAARMRAHAGTAVADAIGQRAWTIGLHVRHADPETAERRLQALRLHPWAAAIVSADPVLRDLVDRGRPFEEALAATVSGWSERLEEVPLRHATARRLRGMAPIVDPIDLLRVLEGAARLSGSRAPTRDGDASRIARADHACCLFLHGLGIRDGGALLRSMPASIREAPDDKAFDAALSRVREGLWDVADMLTAFAETVGRPLVGGLIAPVAGAAARLFSPDLSYPRLAAASRRWHRGHARFTAALPGPPPDAGWPALFDPVDLPVGIGAACLTSAVALADEGAAGPDADGIEGLGHCVAGYARRCLDGEAHIVSLRGIRDGRRRSTLEIRVESGGRPYAVQHRGRANGKPGAREARAAELLLQALASGNVAMRPEARDPSRARAGRDGLDPGRAAASLAAWAPFLPARLQDPEIVRLRLAAAVSMGTVRPGQA